MNLKNLFTFNSKIDIKDENKFGEKKSFYDDDIGEYALWSDTYNNNDYISQVSTSQLIRLYVGWIYACVNVRSNSIASLEGNLYKSKTQTDTIIENKTVEAIDWELKKVIASSLDLFGSCYLLKEGFSTRVKKFQVLRTDAVSIEYDIEGNVLFYKYFSGNKEYVFTPDEIVCFTSYTPEQGLQRAKGGGSPAMAVAKQQIMDLMAIEYNYLFFKEGGKPGTILQTDKIIAEDQKSRIVSKWNSFFAGLKNSHKTALLDNGLSYQSTTVGQKEMEFTSQREFTREEILGMFGVPLPLLGKSDGVGFADRQVPEYYFQKYHLMPLAKKIENAFNKQVFKGKGYFTFGNIVSADLEGIGKLFEKGAISINELREANGYLPIENGNVNSQGTDVAILDTRKKLFSKNDLQIISKGLSVFKKKDRYEKAENFWQEMKKRVDAEELKMQKEIFDIWDLQEKIIIKNLKKEKSIKEFIEKAKDDPNRLFDGIILGVAWVSSGLKKILYRIISKEGNEAYATTGATGKFNADKLNNWIKTNLNKFGKDIDLQTKKIIIELVTKGFDDGLGEKQIISNIKEQFKEFKKSRIQKIVRTESTKAVGRANMEAYQQAGIEKKEWYTNIDSRSCPHCNSMHRRIVKTGDAFYKKGDTTETGLVLEYETIQHPPLHTNCRCILIPVI